MPQTAIEQYQNSTAQLKTQVQTAQRLAPDWMTAIVWILTFFLVWPPVAQFGLMAQGLENAARPAGSYSRRSGENGGRMNPTLPIDRVISGYWRRFAHQRIGFRHPDSALPKNLAWMTKI